jgi:hypothetical protein
MARRTGAMTEVVRSLRIQCCIRMSRWPFQWVPVDALLQDVDRLATYYLEMSELTCCDVAGGFFIEVDGRLWNEGGVDELWMADSWFWALDDLLSGKDTAAASPWEESETLLQRVGDSLELEDTHAAMGVTFPRIRVDFCDFVKQMLDEGWKLACLVDALQSRLPAEGKRAARVREELGALFDLRERITQLRARAAESGLCWGSTDVNGKGDARST